MGQQKPIYEPLPTGQRKVVPGSQGQPEAPPMLPPQPGLAGVAVQEKQRRQDLQPQMPPSLAAMRDLQVEAPPEMDPLVMQAILQSLKMIPR